MFLFIGLIFLFLIVSIFIYIYISGITEDKTGSVVSILLFALVFWFMISISTGENAEDYGCHYELGSYMYTDETCVARNKIEMKEDYNFFLKFLSGIGYFLFISWILVMIKDAIFPDDD